MHREILHKLKKEEEAIMDFVYFVYFKINGVSKHDGI